MAGELAFRKHINVFAEIKHVLGFFAHGKHIERNLDQFIIAPFLFLNQSCFYAIHHRGFIQYFDDDFFGAPFKDEGKSRVKDKEWVISRGYQGAVLNTKLLLPFAAGTVYWLWSLRAAGEQKQK